MKSKVVLTPDARVDLAEATAWYRERSVRAAEDFLLAVVSHRRDDPAWRDRLV